MKPFKDWQPVRISRREDLTQDLLKFWVEKPANFPFRDAKDAGKYATLGLWGNDVVGVGQNRVDKFIPRPYSIASAPHEPFLEFFVERVPGEYQTDESLTPRLWELKENDTVVLSPKALGAFTLQSQHDAHIFIATVTGVAPFVSMVRARLAGAYAFDFAEPFYLLQGASTQREFGYLDELRRATNAGKYRKLFYIPTVSRPYGCGKPGHEENHGWLGEAGRVNEIFQCHLNRFHLKPSPQTLVYLCGNEGMIDDLARGYTDQKGRGHRKLKEGEAPGKLVTAGFNIIEEVFF